MIQKEFAWSNEKLTSVIKRPFERVGLKSIKIVFKIGKQEKD